MHGPLPRLDYVGAFTSLSTERKTWGSNSCNSTEESQNGCIVGRFGVRLNQTGVYEVRLGEWRCLNLHVVPQQQDAGPGRSTPPAHTNKEQAEEKDAHQYAHRSSESMEEYPIVFRLIGAGVVERRSVIAGKETQFLALPIKAYGGCFLCVHNEAPAVVDATIPSISNDGGHIDSNETFGFSLEVAQEDTTGSLWSTPCVAIHFRSCPSSNRPTTRAIHFKVSPLLPFRVNPSALQHCSSFTCIYNLTDLVSGLVLANRTSKMSLGP